MRRAAWRGSSRPSARRSSGSPTCRTGWRARAKRRPKPRAAAGRGGGLFRRGRAYFPELEAGSRRRSPRSFRRATIRWRRCGAVSRDVQGRVRILPAHVMPVEQLRYDRHTLRLFISERVPLIERPFLVARQIAFLGHRELLDRLTQAAGMTEPEAARICRQRLRAGGSRRRCSPRRAGSRRRRARAAPTSMLCRSVSCSARRGSWRASRRSEPSGASGLPPAFMIVLDGAGACCARMPGAGFPFPRLAPFCARLPIFDDSQAGRPFEGRAGASGRKPLSCGGGDRGRRLAPGLPPPRRLR